MLQKSPQSSSDLNIRKNRERESFSMLEVGCGEVGSRGARDNDFRWAALVMIRTKSSVSLSDQITAVRMHPDPHPAPCSPSLGLLVFFFLGSFRI